MAKARQLKVFDMKATALIGEWIRDYMETHKLSQEKMAGIVGCDANSINAWARGMRPPGESWANRLAEALGRPLAEVYTILARANNNLPDDLEVIPKATGSEGSETGTPLDESHNRSAIKQSVQKAA